MRIFSDDKYLYSVDMMFLHTKNMKSVTIPIGPELRSQLDKSTWLANSPGPDGQDNWISPNQVIMTPVKYPGHWRLIKEANMSYPIIIGPNRIIIDGLHRIGRAVIEQQTSIQAYVIDYGTLKKFMIGKANDTEDILRQNIWRIIYQAKFKPPTLK